MSSSPHPWRRHLLSLFAIAMSLIAITLYVQDSLRHEPKLTMTAAVDPTQETALLRELLLGEHVQSGQICRELASNPAHDALVVWVLSDPHAFDPPDATFRRAPYEELFHTINRHKIAFLMEYLHTQCSPALLWAVTNHLTDEHSARFSTEKRFAMFTVRKSDCITRPMRDIARDVLVRELGVDYGYDVDKWRKKILNRS